MTTDHIIGILPISPAAYAEIRGKMDAGDLARIQLPMGPDGMECIDMHGLAVGADPNEETDQARRARNKAQAEGTIDALRRTAAMIETYSAGLFPVDDQGKVHFARAIMDSAAAELRAFLATCPPGFAGFTRSTVDDPYFPHEALTPEQSEEVLKWYREVYLAKRKAGGPVGGAPAGG